MSETSTTPAVPGAYRAAAFDGMAAGQYYTILGPDGRRIAVAFTTDDAELIVSSLNRWRRWGVEVSDPPTHLVGAWNRAIERALERGAHALSKPIAEMRAARNAMAAVIVAAQAYRREYGNAGNEKQRKAAEAFDQAMAKLVGIS
jgi:hypothetical protein